MGTRNLTIIVKDNTVRLCQYGQWDGYFSYTGKHFMKFCYERLNNESSIETFKRKVDVLKPVDCTTYNNLMQVGKDIEEINDFYIPKKMLFPQFHRDTGIEILNIIQEINAYDFRDGAKYYPVELQTDIFGVEFIYVIDLDDNKIYMLSCWEMKKPIELTKTFLNKLPYSVSKDIGDCYKCFLSYDLLNLPTVDRLIEDYNSKELEDELEVTVKDLTIYFNRKDKV